MLKSMLLSLLCLVLARSAMASDIIGNGGDVLNCAIDVLALDLYEAETMRGLHFDTSLVNEGDEPIDVVNKAIDRLALYDLVRAETYRGWAATFFSEMRFMSNANLTDIPDSGHLAVPDNCQIEQVAIQITPVFKQDPRYMISEKLWLRMRLDARAALIMHEIVYREALALGHKNSIATRHMASYMLSSAFPLMSPAEYFETAQQGKFFMFVPLENVTWHGKQVFLDTHATNDIEQTCMSEGLDPLIYAENRSTKPFGLAPAVGTLIAKWMPTLTDVDVQVKSNFGDLYAYYTFNINGRANRKDIDYVEPRTAYHFCIGN